MKLVDKVALITGAGSGIGEATAAIFAGDGAKVAICDVNLEGIKRVAEDIKTKGGEAIAVQVDITNKEQVDKAVKEVLEKFSRLDILVNNAGINRDATLKKMDEEKWDAVINVNLKGTFLVSKTAMLPMIEARYGKIINTASIGMLGNIGQANYAASKAGIVGFTKTIALELARYNINVNCIAPGATETPMTKGIPEDIKKMIIDKIPFRRFAKPQEIANLSLFLASDEASYITGQVIFVDGGISVGI